MPTIYLSGPNTPSVCKIENKYRTIRKAGIPTAVHYPSPFESSAGQYGRLFRESAWGDRAASEVLSLPMPLRLTMKIKTKSYEHHRGRCGYLSEGHTKLKGNFCTLCDSFPLLPTDPSGGFVGVDIFFFFFHIRPFISWPGNKATGS